jgi:hypothetical protein
VPHARVIAGRGPLTADAPRAIALAAFALGNAASQHDKGRKNKT